MINRLQPCKASNGASLLAQPLKRLMPDSL